MLDLLLSAIVLSKASLSDNFKWPSDLGRFKSKFFTHFNRNFTFLLSSILNILPIFPTTQITLYKPLFTLLLEYSAFTVLVQKLNIVWAFKNSQPENPREKKFSFFHACYFFFFLNLPFLLSPRFLGVLGCAQNGMFFSYRLLLVFKMEDAAPVSYITCFYTCSWESR